MPAETGVKLGVYGLSDFKSQLKQASAEINKYDQEYKSLKSGLSGATTAQERFEKLAPALKNSISACKDKITALNGQLEEQRKKLEKASEKVDECTQKYGENSEQVRDAQGAYERQKVAVINAEAALAKATTTLHQHEGELSSLEKACDDVSEGEKDVGNSAKDSGKKVSTFGDVLKANLTSEAIIGGVKKIADVVSSIGSACVEAGKKLVGFFKTVVTSYADLEQNLGGSEAVFGEYSDTVQKTAEEAYRTMGTTQSEYLATANKMGALFQGSGLTIQRSAELSTKAMQRAADMASVMGIDTADALEAVSGAAKGNYTMMDNLGVAMNATTLEAYRLDQGIETAFSKMSNAEKAELAMQYFFERTSQYAGNFEKEASTTISGSIGMLTSALQTWVAGLGNSEADIENLTNNILTAFQNTVENVTPIVQNIIDNLPAVISAVIASLDEMLPSIVDSLVSLITSLASTIEENQDSLIECAQKILDALFSAFTTLLPVISNLVVKLVLATVDFLFDNIDTIVNAVNNIAMTIFRGLGEMAKSGKLSEAIHTLISCITTFVNENIVEIIGIGISIVLAIIAGIVQSIPELLSSFVYIVGDLYNTLTDPETWAGVGEFFSNLWGNIKESFSNSKIVQDFKSSFETLGTAVKTYFNPDSDTWGGNLMKKYKEGAKSQEGATVGFFDFLKGELKDKLVQDAKDWGEKVLNDFKGGIESVEEKLNNKVNDITTSIKNYFSPDSGTWGSNLLNKFKTGVDSVKEKLRTTITGITDKIKEFFTPASDSWGMALINNFKTGVSNAWDSLKTFISGIVDKIKNFFSFKNDSETWGEDLLDGFKKGMDNRTGILKSAVNNLAQYISDRIGFSEPKEGPLSDFHTYAPDMIDLFAKGIRENAGVIKSAIGDSFNVQSTIMRTVDGDSVGATSSINTTNYNGSVSINVYGTASQSANDIADEVMDRITAIYNSNAAVFA